MKMHTPAELHESHLIGHVEGTEQTAAHFKPLLATKNATIAELKEKLNALEAERDQALADLEKEREDGLSQFEQDSLFDEDFSDADPWKGKYVNLLLEHVDLQDRHISLLRRLRGEEEAEDEGPKDEAPESPAKRQCLSGTQIHELD